MAPQELICSSCSAEATASSSVQRAQSTPAIHLHDLHTTNPVQAFKTSTSSLNSLGYVQSQNSTGGTVFAVQESKALLNIWAWQKDQMHLKLHLPERLSCFSVSPNGCWAAGGSPNGHIYLWEIASGLLMASITAHYRAVTSLTFSNDSRILISASQDASVHVYLVSKLVDEEDSGVKGKPYGSLGDHTLAIRAVALGRTAGSSGGRCWTASDDGTVKMWSLYPQFDLLATFSFPPSVIPSCIAVDPSERFIYVGTTSGDIYHIPLFRRRAELGSHAGQGDLEAVGGGGPGTPAVKAEGSVLNVKSPITCLALSMSSSHLIIGTHSGDIHIHSLPSHQHLRTISCHSGPITHLSTLLKPQDLTGTPYKTEHWQTMDIKPFERMRVGKPARDVQEVTILLRPSPLSSRLDGLRPPVPQLFTTQSTSTVDSSDRIAELLAENKKLKAGFERAVKINEKIWAGVVDMQLAGAATRDSNGTV